jgi:hypothetical protein
VFLAIGLAIGWSLNRGYNKFKRERHTLRVNSAVAKSCAFERGSVDEDTVRDIRLTPWLYKDSSSDTLSLLLHIWSP